MKKTLAATLLVAVTLSLSTNSAWADDESCSQTCPSGEKLVSFGDGQSAKCYCAAHDVADPGDSMVSDSVASPQEGVIDENDDGVPEA